MYQHVDTLGNPIPLPAGKVVCVGRNYLDHIQELNNKVPEQALLFIKPATALCDLSEPVVIPKNLGSCHNELEIAVLIQQRLCKASPAQAAEAVWGFGLALDLTLREVQDKLKANGQPWERAKAFDLSCPVSGFVAVAEIGHEPQNWQGLEFALSVNGEIRQQGNSANMLRDIVSLLVEISDSFTLLPGDMVLTGTPKGVGPLEVGDNLSVSLTDYLSVHYLSVQSRVI
jgi:2-keto-4-pentenoate hydratase/2-oxohepta-3-ene-1,7-dioic acid hydratase in catechol pathway